MAVHPGPLPKGEGRVRGKQPFSPELPRAPLINTPLQRGGNIRCGSNCFNSFATLCETVETVPLYEMATYTPLKQGVNDIRRFLVIRAIRVRPSASFRAQKLRYAR